MPDLSTYLQPTVLIICLCVGYAIKHIKWLDKISHDYIPLIMLILGAVLTVIMQGNYDLVTIADGMVTGLASTGLHQAFTRTIQALDGDEKDGPSD